MISYILKKNNEIKTFEDSLTSCVFDLLKYFPSELFWKILKGSLYYDKLPTNCGEIIEFQFWPKWDPKGTQNKNHVEPDLFLKCDDFNVIIEAKRKNEDQQYEEQKENQLISYFNEFDKKVFYIQVGGLIDLNDDKNKTIYQSRYDINNNIVIKNSLILPKIENNIFEICEKSIICCKTDWSKLLNKINEEYEILKNVDLNQFNAYKRIFKDLIKSFEIHGYYRKSWINSMNIRKININNNLKKLFDYASKRN